MTEEDRRIGFVLDELKKTIARGDLTQAEIESSVGWSARYVTRILHGHIELKMSHILTILDATGEKPEAFFTRCFNGARPEPARLTDADRRELVSELLQMAAEAMVTRRVGEARSEG